MAKLLSYEEKGTWMEQLCGVTKMIFFLAWTITCMLTYDTRVLATMLVISLILFKLSKTSWKQIGSVFSYFYFCTISGRTNLWHGAYSLRFWWQMGDYPGAAFL